jgi:cell wall-associated NlpC family hydrolase
MIYTYEIEGLTFRTGDLICTQDGSEEILPGQFWRLLGRLVPGEADHVIIYLGPNGRCIEACGLGVNLFEVENGIWNGPKMMDQRGLLVDTFLGGVYPLEESGLSEKEQLAAREDIAAYCLAQLGKPYNINYLNSETENAFYCSQFAYKAYQRHGINLNTGMSVPNLPGTEKIVLPQEIWAGFMHRRAAVKK